MNNEIKIITVEEISARAKELIKTEFRRNYYQKDEVMMICLFRQFKLLCMELLTRDLESREYDDYCIDREFLVEYELIYETGLKQKSINKYLDLLETGFRISLFGWPQLIEFKNNKMYLTFSASNADLIAEIKIAIIVNDSGKKQVLNLFEGFMSLMQCDDLIANQQQKDTLWNIFNKYWNGCWIKPHDTYIDFSSHSGRTETIDCTDIYKL